MDELKLRRTSILLMVICAALWSIAGIFIKMIPWNSFVIAGVRSLIASGIVALYMKQAKVKFVINKLSVLSGIMLCMTFLAFVTANKMTTAANAIVLQFSAPVFIMVLSSLLYKQRFRRSDYIVVGITILGIALCFLDQLSAGNLPGNFVGLFSGMSMACMFVLTGHADNDSRMSGIFLGQLFTALIGVPMIFLFPTPVSAQTIISIIVLGIFQLGIPYVLYGIAVGHCSPLVCCLVGAIEPLLNPLWVFLFDGELPGVYAMVGGLIVVATVTIWCVWSDRQAAANV